jgi:hypothetical protein
MQGHCVMQKIHANFFDGVVASFINLLRSHVTAEVTIIKTRAKFCSQYVTTQTSYLYLSTYIYNSLHEN